MVQLSRSNFPNSIDTFQEVYDLPPSLVISARRYQELKAQPTLNSTEQAELNALTANLSRYIISPETWNKFSDSLVAMQNFIKSGVSGYIEEKQALWATYVKEFTFKGAHSTSKSFKFQNMVMYNGDLYLAIANVPTGIQITNTAYWQKISSKGDKGDVGLNTHLKGDYSATATYAIGDAVVYEGNIYYCTKATTAGVAPTNSEYWHFYDSTIISNTQPTYRKKGLLWVEVTG